MNSTILKVIIKFCTTKKLFKLLFDIPYAQWRTQKFAEE